MRATGWSCPTTCRWSWSRAGAGDHLDVVAAQIAAGRHVVSTSDDPDEVRALLELSDRAEATGVSVVLGAAMSPGLSCLLVAHGATALDRVDEVHVARHGVAGPACARQRLRALRGTALDWRDGEWVRRPGFSGRELNWFPDPVGGRDCYRAALAEPLLVQPVFADRRARDRPSGGESARPCPGTVPGAVAPAGRGGHRGGPGRVARRSRRWSWDGRVRRAGSAGHRLRVRVAAVAALEAAAGRLQPGAGGLAGSGRHLEMLTELARRGVRAAVFEGGAVTSASVAPPTVT